MANIDSPNTTPPGITVPSTFPNTPQPGKIEQLYNANNAQLYSKLSPYTGVPQGLFGFGIRQPFVWVNPNDANKGVNKLRKYGSTSFPIGDGIVDTERMAKFMGSGDGILFLIKQFAAQNGNAFPETRLYNPAEVLVSAARPISLFLIPRVSRHVDLGNGLLGVLTSLIGINLTNGPTSPITTTGYKNDAVVLPSSAQDGGKGLLRGPTANSAYNTLKNNLGGGSKPGLSDLAKSLFASFIPVKSPGTYKADETAYEMMLNSPKLAGNQVNSPTSKGGIGGLLSAFIPTPTSYDHTLRIRQRWYNPKGTSNPNIERRLKLINGTYVVSVDTLDGQSIGYSLTSDGKYGKSVFAHDDYTNSDMILIYKNSYSEQDSLIPGGIGSLHKRWEIEFDINGNYLKNREVNSVDKITGTYANDFSQDIDLTSSVALGHQIALVNNESLVSNIGPNKQINGNNTSVFTKTGVNANKTEIVNQLNALLNLSKDYTVSPSNTGLLSRVNTSYNELVSNKNNQGLLSSDTTEGQYVFKSLNQTLQRGKRMVGPGRRDYVNSLTVLDNKMTDTNGNVYKPYDDDLIAFYFHDLVNDKYIPFRCTVKGINEQYTAEWADIKYVGRANKLYNYTGFSRNINFSFDIVATSVQDLLPMWNRINYLCGLVKPSKYTIGQFDSQFPIPPLTTFTIGDLYKEQPFVITTINFVVPDDTLWETLSEDSGNDWNYLNQRISWKNSVGKFAQFPRMCQISIAGNIIEREIPMVGLNNYGDINKPDENTFSSNMVTVL